MVEVHGLVRTELRPMSETRFFARMKGEVELDFLMNGPGGHRPVSLNEPAHPRWRGAGGPGCAGCQAQV
ncbi:hypothetical protein [Nonomuraea jabiensis]|uniref:hypothetical protein n=1 Tax=Nonomuraea jabiensis TaxID=882448 RepID=UPI003D73C897